MTLASAWSYAISARPPADAHATIRQLLEPRHPSSCASYDWAAQRAVPLPRASEALEQLSSSYPPIATSSKDVRSRSRIIKDSLVEWYADKCDAAFPLVCQELLAPLRQEDPAQASTEVANTFEGIARWMHAWASPLLPGGLIECATGARRFLLQFHTQLRLHIDDRVLKNVRTFLARAVPLKESPQSLADIDRLASSAEALGLSAMLLTLLTGVLHSEVSRKVTSALDGQGADEDDEVWEFEEAARDRLVRWLDSEAKPRFQSILQRCAPKHAASTEADAMDVCDEADRIVEDELSDEGAWERRLDYHLDRTLCSVRASQLFDLIAIYPDSIPALEDLQTSLQQTGDRLLVARALSEALQTRLLHPGAHTRDIIQIYVHMVRALRDVDPSGVVLSRVVSPLRRYLRARRDTIRVIVSSLLGEDPEFTLLKDELEAADAESADEADTSATHRRRRRRQSMPKGSRKRSATATASTGAGEQANGGYSSGSDSSDSDYQDPDWQPKPVDAGREYRLSTSRDMIGMLISIFDDRAGFILALEKSMAEQLVRIRGYRAMREYRNNMILKKRFGDKNMGKCDVMLGDVTESRRVDAGVHQKVERQRRNYAELNHEGRERERERGTNEVLDALHPLVVSRQFWPDLSTMAAPSATTVTATTGTGTGTAAAAAGVGAESGSSGAKFGKLPRRFAEATQRYGDMFKTSKAMRRLEWLHHLGSVEVQVTMQDGRQCSVECSLLEASVVELAAAAAANTVGVDSASSMAVVADQQQQQQQQQQEANREGVEEGAAKTLSVDFVVQELGVEKRADAVRALRFWCRLGVLRQSEASADCYEVVEHDDEEEENEGGEEQA
ncbi:uncharacterized protein PFL1_02821 [Pseudozyma flocculosa PF-1]|uniref:Related to component of the anaphase promoting complex n=2 Tax=Pseudozyma flocculosa TaxID=84751 RepID=A0A5C3F2N9_9BASI|nr:uncharacterized protein PFL1_02821 [Pseudozyma flocculosa PF-1]EPQ29602.1 hypothetical protein PFL1_02821 [Pseudozyma flocculosa PF-1]SPO38156.1 related to component of the anaphase promoting complex [Pseudozyma flocculosa]